MDDDFWRRQDERIAAEIRAANTRRMWAKKTHADNERRRVYGNRNRHAEKIARMRKVTLQIPVTVVKSEGTWTRLTAFPPTGQIIWLHIPTEWIVLDREEPDDGPV